MSVEPPTMQLEQLNPAQREAVTHTEGPLLILAGAGSGKTRVLTYRIAHILEQGLARRNQIMAVTFTNKAAREMKERLAEICGPGRFPDLGTFHAVCTRWLRRHPEAVGLNSNFVIYATAEQRLLMKEVLRDMGKDIKKFTPRSFLSQVSHWKNHMITPSQAAKQCRLAYEQDRVKAYEMYQERLHRNQAVDFDDILLKTVQLFRNHPQILEDFQERIHYILIDEYQDVNPVQYELVRTLAGKRRNLCAVGDDDQSIYAFRGADISILLSFEKHFPEAKIVKLEQNYRSSQWILAASNQVVSNNRGRRSKALWTARKGGEKLTYHSATDGRDEARWVARTIRGLGNRKYSDVVILYRTNAQSRLLEEGMIQGGIPYKIVGGVRFFERKEIKDILSYLAVLINPADSVSVKRIVNAPARGVGATSIQRLEEWAQENDAIVYEALFHTDKIKLPGKARKNLEELALWMEELRESLEFMSVTDLVVTVLTRSGYTRALEEENSVEARARLENLDELVNVTGEFDRNAEETTLEAFLSEVSLLSDQDTYEEAPDTVTLMTLHAAKGLEFPVVFLVGMEEETFPHSRSIDDPDQMEEERRLCYVGMTRAMDKLYLTSARSRNLHGMPAPKKVSRFLEEIPEETMDGKIMRWAPEEPPAIGSSQWRGWGRTSGGRSAGGGRVKTLKGDAAKRAAPKRSTPKAKPVSAFSAGDRVLHQTFGLGRVSAAKGDIVTVDFDTKGTKKLKQSFLQMAPADATTEEAPKLRVGDRVEHSRWGSGIVKHTEQETVTVIFPGITLNMSVNEACRK